MRVFLWGEKMPLPSIQQFIASDVTEAGFKNAMSQLIQYLQTGVASNEDFKKFINTAQLIGLSGLADTNQKNKWAVIVFDTPQDAYVQKTDFSDLYKNPIVFKGFVNDVSAETRLTYPYTNMIFRSIVTVEDNTVINFDSFMVDDAVSIFVNGVNVHVQTGTSTQSNVSFELTKGSHIIDLLVNNGASWGGFVANPSLSSQVTSMYASELPVVSSKFDVKNTSFEVVNSLNRALNGFSINKFISQDDFSFVGQVVYSSSVAGENGKLLQFDPLYTTDFIKVNKGDCICVYVPTYHDYHYTPITFFNTNQIYVGTLAHGKPSQIANPIKKTNLERQRQKAYGDQQENSFFISGIAPADGYVRITAPKGLWLNPVEASPIFGEISAFIVKQNEFSSLENLYVAPKNLFKALEQKWYTPSVTSFFTTVNESRQTPGNPMVFDTSWQTSIFKVPVVAGQYFHIIGSRVNAKNMLFLTDFNDKYLQSIRLTLNEVTCYQTNVNPVANVNIQIPQSGYLYIQQSSEVASLFAIAFTDQPVSYEREYFKNEDQIEWLDASIFGSSVNTMSGLFVNKASQRGLVPNSASYVQPNYGNFVSQPFILKKGDILEFTSKIAMPIHMHAFELDKLDVDTNSFNVYNLDSVTEDVRLSLLNNTIDLTRWWNPVESTSYYCNEDQDTLIYLCVDRRNEVFKQVARAKIISREQYIEKREELLKGNLAALCKLTYTTMSLISNTEIGLKPILVFKDEVICYPCPTMYVDIASTNFDGGDLSSFTSSATQIPVWTPEAVDPKDIVIGTQGYAKQTVLVKKTGYVLWSGPYYLSDLSGKYSSTNVAKGVRNLLDYIPFKIQHKNDFKPNGDMETYIRQYYVFKNNAGNPQYVLSNNDASLKFSPVIKGKKYKINRNVSGYLTSAQTWFFDIETREMNSIFFTDVDDNPRVLVHGQGAQFYFEAPADGYIIVPSVYNDIYAPESNHSIVELTNDQWNREAVPTNQTVVYLPETPALRINLANVLLPYDSTKETTVRGLAQFKLGDQILNTVNCDFTVQGIGSATLPKKNWDMDYLNQDGSDSIEVKIGDWLAQDNLVLKGQGVDATHFRNEANYELWVAMRKHEPYPYNMIVGKEALDNQTLPLWFTDALCHPKGLVTELYCGEVFYGIYTLRMKKKREQYAMVKSNKNHIMLQADPTMNASIPFSWSNISLANWELRNPSIKTYSEGDDSVDDSVVQASLDRYFNWIRSVFDGTKTLKSTYQQYINLNSWLDYILHVELTDQWDGLTNNMMVATWDANVWHAMIYDLDHATDRGYTVCHTMISNQSNLFFKFFFSEMLAEMKSRWSELRSSGVLSMAKIHEYHAKYANRVATATRHKDAVRWGYGRENDMPRIFTMFSKKMDYMDAYFDYKPAEADWFGNWNPDNLLAFTSKSYDFNAPSYMVGDIVKYSFTRDFELAGTTLTFSVVEDGKVRVVHNNPTANAVNISTGVLKIFKK